MDVTWPAAAGDKALWSFDRGAGEASDYVEANRFASMESRQHPLQPKQSKEGHKSSQEELQLPCSHATGLDDLRPGRVQGPYLLLQACRRRSLADVCSLMCNGERMKSRSGFAAGPSTAIDGTLEATTRHHFVLAHSHKQNMIGLRHLCHIPSGHLENAVSCYCAD